jgi:hypothetical protein
MVPVIFIYHQNKSMILKELDLLMYQLMKVEDFQFCFFLKSIFNYLAANRCRLLRAKLWDIETIDEFDYVLTRIYSQTKSFDSPRIAVNFTIGKRCKFD